jgi:hypothetical protein
MHGITHYLESEERALYILLLEACAGLEVDAERYARFRAGLLRQIAIEENILLPAARKASRTALQRAARMNAEHGALTSLLVSSPDLARCVEIAAFMEDHEALELGPSGLYAECERALSAAQSRELLDAARAYRIVPLAPSLDGARASRTESAAPGRG